jgi:flagella basal body P-ring formation protein FlgA
MRNPNPESRIPKEARNPKLKGGRMPESFYVFAHRYGGTAEVKLPRGVFGLRASGFFRISTFAFRAFCILAFLACLTGTVRADGVMASSPIPATAAAPSERLFEQTELISLLTTTLQQDYVKDKGDLELRVTQPWTARKVPTDPITLKILEMPTIGVSSSFIVRFELDCGDKNLGSWQLPVQAKVWREAWVAHSSLKRGDSLAGADVSRERRDMLMVHEPLAEFSPNDSTLEIAEPVAIGQPLFARCIRPTPVVHRGQTVTALVEDGALSVTMKVEVLEDGAPGQIVRARNQQSLRNLRGKVLNEQTIQISL